VTTTCLTDRTAPGELLRLVADSLTGADFDVCTPGDGEGYRLDIGWPRARCTLVVGECGSAEWEYCPWSPQDADPDLTADLATALLTGCTPPQPCLASGHLRQNITFKGIVGLELKARGLDVELAVYCDEAVFDTFTEIIATVPVSGNDAQVCVTHDGGLTWTRDYQSDPAAVARFVVEAVTQAMSCLRPGGTGGAGHG
jgi:hypothetical protein